MIFPITQILRETNFGDSRSSKSAILTHLEALNFYFLWSFALFEGCYQINKIESPWNWKKAVLKLLDASKLISRKIWMPKNPEIFHTVILELFRF